ncbi:unnamed protein product [Effrenium voratum]|nr:unnamed protein product [Effrenium voratum]
MPRKEESIARSASPRSPRSPSPRSKEKSGFEDPWPWWEPLPRSYTIRRKWHEIARFHEAVKSELANDPLLGYQRVKAKVPVLPEPADVDSWLKTYAATNDACAAWQNSLCIRRLIWVLEEVPAEVLASSRSLRRFVTGGVSGKQSLPIPPRFLGKLVPTVPDAEDMERMQHSRSAGGLRQGEREAGKAELGVTQGATTAAAKLLDCEVTLDGQAGEVDILSVSWDETKVHSQDIGLSVFTIRTCVLASAFKRLPKPVSSVTQIRAKAFAFVSAKSQCVHPERKDPYLCGDCPRNSATPTPFRGMRMARASSLWQEGVQLPWGIRKRLLQQGSSQERPVSGDEVKIHFEGRLQDGTSIGSTKEPFTFIVDQRKGEVAEFTIAPRFAYDDLGSPPLVPPDATLVFELELLEWENKSDVLNDGRAIKTIVERGAGRRPQKGQDVVVSLKITSRKGKVLQDEDIDHTVGASDFGQLSAILSEVILSMAEGERCTVFLRRFAGDKIDSTYSGATADLTLRRIFETTDVSPEKDGALMKKLLTSGSDDPPRALDDIALQVDSVTAEVNSLKQLSGQVLNFRLGGGEVCDALDFAAETMTVGEEAVLTWKVQFPEAERVVVKLKLAGIGRRHAGVAEQKDAAAQHFKSERFALALQVYRRLRSLKPEPELHCICELNEAACLLKLRKFHDAKQLCSDVLASNPQQPHQIKALYRRASAEFQLSDFAAALQDLTVLLKIQPGNGEARALAEQVREAQRAYAKQAKETAARMFANARTAPAPEGWLRWPCLPCLPCHGSEENTRP